jgi:hypothetical protein
VGVVARLFGRRVAPFLLVSLLLVEIWHGCHSRSPAIVCSFPVVQSSIWCRSFVEAGCNSIILVVPIINCSKKRDWCVEEKGCEWCDTVCVRVNLFLDFTLGFVLRPGGLLSWYLFAMSNTGCVANCFVLLSWLFLVRCVADPGRAVSTVVSFSIFPPHRCLSSGSSNSSCS